jgi:transcriptional regulator with XRE-family HTH domain
MENIQGPEQEYIRRLIEKKLDQSNLSMRQLAKKWDTSISFLSQVKNKKRAANIDLAIKIMQEMNIPIDEKAHYCKLIQNRKSKHILDIEKEIEKQNRKKLLSSNLSQVLSGEANALNIFLDISLAESEGVSLGQIFRNYGNQGIKVADLLAASEYISKKSNTYYINEENTHFTPSREMLFGIINKVNENLNSKVHTGEFVGCYNLEVHDLSEEGLSELKKLHHKQVTEVQEVIIKHKKEMKDGGVRVSFSHVLGKIMEKVNTVIISMALVMIGLLHSDSSMSGGISGGHTGMELQKLSYAPFSDLIEIINEDDILSKMNSGNVFLPHLKLKLRRGNVFGKNRLKANWVMIPLKIDNKKNGFDNKNEALIYLKAMMKNGKSGLFEKSLALSIKTNCHKSSGLGKPLNREKLSLTHRLTEKGMIYKSSMRIEEYLDQQFNFKYKILIKLHIPCSIN